jgi:DNA (cytosine-5)-methyltransferase 1
MAHGLPDGLDGVWSPSTDTHPLTAKKVEGRVGLLRGYGNAIVPQAAAEFIRTFMELRDGTPE